MTPIAAQTFYPATPPRGTGQALPAAPLPPVTSLLPIDWGPGGTACLNSFVKQWQQRIMHEDPLCFTQVQQDIFQYLAVKATQVIKVKRSIGQAGYAFAGADNVYKGLIWSAGSKDQETPFLAPQCGERWWPVIIVDLPGDVVAVYCPGLAWQNSRPWFAHRSRVRVWVSDLTAAPCCQPPVSDSGRAQANAALSSHSDQHQPDIGSSTRNSEPTDATNSYDLNAMD